LSNKKGEESTKNKTRENKEGVEMSENPQEWKQEDEDTSSTANAQPIETEPPEEEDPGTCEITGSWAMVGTCNADGTAKYTQTYKESKPGACPSSVKADFKPCCYQKGDWEDISECKPTGKKTQKQTTINCAENFKTREVECPYEGEWKKIGSCSSDGNQEYYRITVNSTKDDSKTEKCCYTTSDWRAYGGCEDHEPGFQKYTKTYVGECRDDEVIKFERCRKCRYETIREPSTCARSLGPGAPREYVPCTRTKYSITDEGLGTGKCPRNITDYRV
jgi:hypothetical protein